MNTSIKGTTYVQQKLARTITQPLRYAGYYFDEETGLYYLKSRYYSPETGRFLTKDAYSYVRNESLQTLNLYVYCGNNPIRFTNPTGTNWGEFVDWIRGLIDDVDNGLSEGGQALEDSYDSMPQIFQGLQTAFTETGEYLSSAEAIKAYLQTGGTVLLVCAGPTREFGPEITYYATLIEGKAYLYAYPATQVTENVVDMYQKTPIRTYGGFLYELKKNSSDLFEKLLGK